MVHDPLAVGTKYPDRQVCVDDEYLSRYIDGVNAADNFWYTSISPYGRPVCPASILFYEPSNFEIPETDSQLRHFGIDRTPFNSGVEWEHFSPIYPGEPVSLSQKVIDRWLKRGREWVIFEMESRNPSGDLLSLCRFKESWLAQSTYDPLLPSRDGETSDLVLSHDGALLGEYACFYTREMSTAFCRPNRDFHTELDLALAQGFPDVVISGPQISSQMSELMTRIFGRGYLEGGRLRVNFLRPVYAGDTITVRVSESDDITSLGDTSRRNVVVWAENQHGQTTAGGLASARLLAEDFRPDIRKA